MDPVDASSRSLGGAAVGFFIGAFVGSAIGIAGFGTAISGTVPIGILGAWLGYRHCKPAVPDNLDAGKPDRALKYVRHAALLAVDLLVLLLLFIRKTLRRSNQPTMKSQTKPKDNPAPTTAFPRYHPLASHITARPKPSATAPTSSPSAHRQSTYTRRISRTILWAICKLFFIFYMINVLLSPLVVVVDPYLHPIGPTLAGLLVLAPIAILARRAYIRLER
jgi:hypothetical protein